MLAEGAEESEEEVEGVGADEVEGADGFLRHVHSLSQTGQISSRSSSSSSWSGLWWATTAAKPLFTIWV